MNVGKKELAQSRKIKSGEFIITRTPTLFFFSKKFTKVAPFFPNILLPYHPSFSYLPVGLPRSPGTSLATRPIRQLTWVSARLFFCLLPGYLPPSLGYPRYLTNYSLPPAAGLSPQVAVTSILLYLSTSTVLASPEAPYAI